MTLRLLRGLALFTAVAFATQSPSAASSATPSPAASQGLPSVQTIFKRHLEAVGRLPALVARWSGSIVQAGQTIRYEITATRGGRYRRKYTFPMMSEVDGSNDVVDWEQDENGNVRTAPAQPHSSMDSRLERLNDVTFDPATSSVLAGSDLDGRHVYSVSTRLRGETVVIYFDATTWLIDGADVGNETVRYRSYRRFEGVSVPSDIEEASPDRSVSITVDTLDFVLEAPSMFDPPAQREPIFPTGVDHVEVNFDSPRGLIVCSIKLDGHPTRFLVDSGSTTSVIDAGVAQRFGLPQGGKSTVEGATTFNGTVARIDSLDIGGIRFEPLFVRAIPLRLPTRISNEGIEGILGYDLFSALVTRISYKRGQIEFTLPASFSYHGTGSVIPADVANHIPIITASIGNDHRGIFSVDTGSTASLVLYKRFADANSAEFLNPTEHDIGIFQEFIYDPEDFAPSTASGAGGDFPTRHAVLDRLNLGTFSLPDLPTEIVLRDAGAFSANSSTDGIVGGASLATFAAVFFDYPGGRLILEK